MIVRIRAYTECSSSQNQTIQLTIGTTTPQIITQSLTINTSTIV